MERSASSVGKIGKYYACIELEKRGFTTELYIK